LTSVEIDPVVFNSVYIPHLKDMERIQICFGGASSGKSVFLAQRDIIDIMKGGRNFLVVRQVGRTLRGSVVQEIIKIIGEWNLSHLFSINKNDGTVTCINGYQILFAGLDDVEKLKSITPAKGVITDVRVEEATEVDYRSVKQLMRRQRGGDKHTPKRITLSFNPILQSHWIYDRFFSKIGWNDDQKEYREPGLSITKTTYRDNKFLTKEDVLELQNETDKYWHDVYSEGRWGILGNVIFTNWSVRDLTDMRDQFTNHRNGLDFGYSADPAAVICTHYDRMRKTIYVYDELYQSGLTNDKLAEEATKLIGTQVVTCDSAEPKSVAELHKYHVSARSAVKGKDSVLHGIQWLQQQTIIVDTKCINSRNELQGYKWKEDKGGVALPVPVDQDNHLIDALRYAYEGDMNSSWVMSRGDE
jgi:phage terminase large subunit